MLGFLSMHLNLNVQTQNINQSIISTKFEFKQKKRIGKKGKKEKKTHTYVLGLMCLSQPAFLS
jgi:hypothetical protein